MMRQGKKYCCLSEADPPGSRFLLDEGRCGILTPEGDVHALADGLQGMFGHVSRERCIAATFKSAAIFSLPSALAAWKRLLEQDQDWGTLNEE